MGRRLWKVKAIAVKDSIRERATGAASYFSVQHVSQFILSMITVNLMGELTGIQSGITKINTADVSPQQSQSLATGDAIQVLQSLAILGSQERGFLRQDLLFELGEPGLSLGSLENLLELLASRQDANDAVIRNIFLVLAEHVASAGNQDTLLGVALSAVPPLSHIVGQKNTQQSTVNQQHVLSVALHDNELGQGNTNAEALLAVGVSILKVVVADFLISERLVSLGQFDEALVQHLNGFILGGVGADFVGVVDERKTFVVARDCSFIGTLYIDRFVRFTSSRQAVIAAARVHCATYPSDAQNIIWVVDLWCAAGCYNDQVDHPCHQGIACDHCDNSLDATLLSQSLTLLRLDQVRMFGLEIGLDAGCGIFEFCLDTRDQQNDPAGIALLEPQTDLCLVEAGCR